MLAVNVKGSSSTDQSGRMGQGFSAVEMASIIGRASTLAERLQGEVITTGRGQALAAKRLDRWKHLTANKGENGFRQTPGPSGPEISSEEELLRLLGEVEPAPGAGLPRWATLLQEIVPAISAVFSTGGPLRRTRSPSTHRTISLAALYAPAVAWARKEVESMSPGPGEWMHDGAWRGLESWLLRRISGVCSLALQPGFLAYKAVRRPGATLVRFEENPRANKDGGAASFFDGFVHAQGRQGLRDFFMDYPVAARLTAQAIVFWIDFVGEFLGRLKADADEISARFLARQPIGKIVRIKAGISDPHCGGRVVLVLHFDSGLRLVYKPRPLQIDAAFSDLLSWLNTQGRLPSLHPPTVLPRESHGWVSFVAHSPCRNRREAKHFYRRAGALLYLIHALRGVDFHRENMIATAEGPVLVDLEALCHPPFSGMVIVDDGKGRSWSYNSSVFRTGMLPIPGRPANGGRYSNLSALGSSILLHSPATEIRWKNINSDHMEAVQGSTRMICETHRPRLHGRLLSIRNHGEELVGGFRRIARFFRHDPCAASRWQATVAAMSGMKTRLIQRPTFLYAMMIGRSLQPRFLVEGVDRSIEFQALPSTPGDEAGRRVELAALEVLDVPIFFLRPGADITAGSDPSGTRNDLASQVAAIRASTRRRRRIRPAN